MKQLNERIAERIISIPDYPVNGVIFRDVMPVFRDAELFRDIILAFAVSHKNDDVDVVAAVEARGFIFGGALAAALGCSFVPVRKAGKLPRECVSESYELEYGLGVIEVQKDSVKPGQRVVIIDDLLATGGNGQRRRAAPPEARGESRRIGFHGRTRVPQPPSQSRRLRNGEFTADLLIMRSAEE